MAALSREEALAELNAGQAELDTLLRRLSDADLNEPGTIGAGDWAGKDLIGHVAFWEELALQAVDAWRAGVPPRAASGTTDELNADNQAQQAGQSSTELRARAASAHAALLALMQGIGESDWYAPMTMPDGSEGSLGEMLGGVLGAPNRPFGHVYAHLDDLRAFADQRAPV